MLEYDLPEENIGEESLQFLGERKDIPFFFVRAGKGIFKHDIAKQQQETRVTRQSLPNKALAIKNEVDEGNSIVVQVRRPEKAAESSKEAETEEQKVRNQIQPVLRRNSLPSSTGLGRRRDSTPAQPSKLSQVQTPPESSQESAQDSVDRPIERPLFKSSLTSPMPITLTVSFKRPAIGIPERFPLKDHKIDVFFNGEFTRSKILNNQQRKPDGWGEFDVVIGGRKISRKDEKAWVMLRPGQLVDGGMRDAKRAKSKATAAFDRWTAISRAIAVESEEWGLDKWGESSCVGEYLTALSKLEMPENFESLRIAGSHKMGIIDVVVTVGSQTWKEVTYGGPCSFKRLVDCLHCLHRYDRPSTRNVDPRFKEPTPRRGGVKVLSSKDFLPDLSQGTSHSGTAKALDRLASTPYPLQPSKETPLRILRSRSGSEAVEIVSPPDFGKSSTERPLRERRPLANGAISALETPVKPRKVSADSPVEVWPSTPSKDFRMWKGTRSGKVGEQSSPEEPQAKLRTVPQAPHQRTPVLRSTDTEKIWGAGAVETRYGITPVDAPARSTRSQRGSFSSVGSSPDVKALESPPGQLRAKVNEPKPQKSSKPATESPVASPITPVRDDPVTHPGTCEFSSHLTSPETRSEWQPSALNNDSVLGYAETKYERGFPSGREPGISAQEDWVKVRGGLREVKSERDGGI